MACIRREIISGRRYTIYSFGFDGLSLSTLGSVYEKLPKQQSLYHDRIYCIEEDINKLTIESNSW